MAICGLAGMGKSSLAAHVARQAAQTAPVGWITLCPGLNDEPEQLLRQIALFVAAHSKTPTTVLAFFRDPSPEHPAGNLPQLLALVVTGLNELTTPLLVFDDAHHLQSQLATLQLLQRIQALAPTCRFLFTTRQELALPGLIHLNLEGLEEKEVEELVKKLLGDRETGAPRHFLTQTAGNPMLIRLAVSHLEGNQALIDEPIGAPLTNYRNPM